MYEDLVRPRTVLDELENFGLWLQRLEMPWIRSLPGGFVDAELSTIARAPVLSGCILLTHPGIHVEHHVSWMERSERPEAH